MVSAGKKQVNYRKAQGYACPRCGSMLEWIFQTDKRGKRHRHTQVMYFREPLFPEAEAIPIMKEISKYEKVQSGIKYRHEFCFECPACGHILAKSQAVKHEFSIDELPEDYYVSEMSKGKLKTIMDAKASGASWETIAELARLPDVDNEFDDTDNNKPQESLWKE